MFLEIPQKRGRIDLICGSMFSGKTEELIRLIRRAEYARLKIEIFKPKTDNRYSDKEVVSHNLKKIKSKVVSSSKEILNIDDDVQVVGIDEAQFFDMELPEVLSKLADRGIWVIVAGLDMDFRGQPFGPMPKIMAIADVVEKVHAICVRCGYPANFSHRLNKSKDLVQLGEKDSYEPLCRACFNKAMSED